MRKSIVYRILFILVTLTFLFTLNTVLSGVTNSQVQLSASLISDSFVSLESEQVKLNKEISQINLSYQMYFSNDSNKSIKNSQVISDSVKLAGASTAKINSICDEYSKQAMNSSLSKAYTPYMSTIKAFLKQADKIAGHINSGDTTSNEDDFKVLKTQEESMKRSENTFQKVLDTSIGHEVGLVHSRVERSTIIIWVMAVLFVIAAALSFFVSMKTIITPLKKVNKSLREIIKKLEEEQGDLTVRIDVSFEDEVGEMARGINRFLETLQHVMISIKSGSNTIYKSTEIISNHIEECKDSTSDVSNALNELSASMEEISSTLQVIDNGAQDVLSAANTIADEASSNSTEVESIADRAEEIRLKSNQSRLQTEKVIKNMEKDMLVSIQNSRSVERIDELTTNILNISDETNMLALNASIEAARAGVVGKGFAVVAEEIRELAESTKKTASDIQNISKTVIESVEQLVKNANEVMSYVTEKVLPDYDGFVNVANNYKSDADTISEMLQHFSSKSSELRSTATNMTDGIGEIVTAAEDSVNFVIHSSENTTNLLISITSISDEASHNFEIVNELNNEINKFKKLQG